MALLAAGLLFAISIGWLAAQDAWRIPFLVVTTSAVVALVNPVAALCLLVFTFPAEILSVGSAGTYARFAGLGVGGILLPQAVASWLRHHAGRPRVSVQAVLLWGFLVFSLVSGIFADDRSAWLKGMWMLFSRAALFAVAYYYVDSVRRSRALLGAVMAAVTIAAALGLGEWLWGYRVVEARTFRAEATIDAVRASGVFESPIGLSFALIAGIGSATFFLVASRGSSRLAGFAAALIMMAALALTMTRSAVVAVLVFFAVLFVMPAVLSRWSRIALVVLLIMTAFAAPNSVKQRFTNLRFLSTESSIHNRPLMLLAGLKMALANPLGVGLRNFEGHYDDYKAVRDVESGRAGHNMFVELTATSGFAGGFCFIAWIAATLVALNRTRRAALTRGDVSQSSLAAFLLAILCAMLVQGLFHTNPYQDKFFWLFMALSLAAIYRQPEQNSSPVPRCGPQSSQSTLPTADSGKGVCLRRRSEETAGSAHTVGSSDRLDGVRACHVSTVHRAVDTRILYKEARSLASAGCEVTVVARWPHSEGWLEGVRILGLPTKGSRWQRLSLLPRALQLALRTRADIYHLHDPELLLIAPALRLLRRKEVVYDVHEYYPEAIPAKEYIPRPLRKPAALAYVLLERLVTPLIAAFVQPTPAQVALCGWTRKPKALVANYAWAEHYPEPDWTTPRPHVAVHTGSMTRSRAIGVIIQAMADVRARVPDARLVLLGQPQSSSYEQELRAFARESGAEKAVEFAGWVPFPQVRETLCSAGVGVSLLLPMADMERCYPTKLFEYMAAGLPVVSDNLPHCRAIVEDAGCGLVVDPTDSAAVADALAYLFEHPAEAVEMGQRGRAAFLAKYTWEGEARRLVGLYQRLAGREGTTPRDSALPRQN